MGSQRSGPAHPDPPPAVDAPRGVYDLLRRPLAERPEAEALVCASGRLTYAELDDAADRAAGALAAAGVQPGDRVAASLPNDVDLVVAFHGAMRLGAVWVGINRVLAPPEKAYMLDDAGVRLLLVDDEILEQMAETGTVGDRLTMVVGGPGDEWRAAVAAADPLRIEPPDPLAPAGIAYTSGTTGFPKGAVHSQASLVAPGAGTVARRRWGPTLRKGDSLALTILNMQVLTTLLTAQCGGTAVIMDHGDSASVARWVREEQVQVWNGPPALLHTLAADPTVTADDFRSLREVWSGGGDCPDALRERFEAKFGVPVVRTYGLTEAPALVALDDLEGPRAPGTSGRPLPHLRVRVLGDDGEDLPAGQVGEICVEPAPEGPWAGCYRSMIGYWERPEATAATLDGGVLHTGDLGSLDPDGHLQVRDRRSAVVIRGGANVYPAEVERVLLQAPGVEAAVVVGVPDERLGQRVGAAVVLRPGVTPDDEALAGHCRRTLAAYKVPERWRYVPTLPRNVMGKVARKQVTAWFEGGAGGRPGAPAQTPPDGASGAIGRTTAGQRSQRRR